MDTKQRKPRGRPSSRLQILDAAETVVFEVGANHLTLEAVADRAGISKGGLLYHFPTKEALLQAMLRRFIEEHHARRNELCARLPCTPDAQFRALIATKLEKDIGDDCQMAQSMLAASAESPQLLDPVREAHDCENAILRQARDPDLARLLWLATEGLMVTEMLAMNPFSAAERASVISLIERLADTMCRPDSPTPPPQQ
ncbi:TetR/AcrR family transcriptional regulator [Kaustia mangrovi]|uniref:TetR/AcrR family transcriptional regulator n=1 Tax=Kaustia mangrovi TaxID=2593653 RepID=A0A7S8C5W1_9HYPH|nr:TetR/AcrR family transcriptional regulator [Kaustia mangrovi]QPC43774.1 TetR/AcrR family transcriptional regulator [Kaustia mangrovi]